MRCSARRASTSRRELTLTGGGRGYIYDNTLIGFFGFGRNPAFYQGAEDNPPPNAAGSSRTGVASCFTDEVASDCAPRS